MHKLEAGSIIKELDLNYSEVRTEMIKHDIEVKPEHVVLNGKGLFHICLNNVIDTSTFMEDDEILIKGFNSKSFLIVKKEILRTA